MPNALSAPPVAPQQQPQEPAGMPLNGAPMASLPQGSTQQQQQQPAPTHQQTVAALRHFQAFGKALQKVLNNPDLGKTDIKGAYIDAMTKLVGERMLSPANAVTILGQLPERPFDQKVALTKMADQIMQAKTMVLAHHGQAYAGSPPEPTPDGEDDHLDTMQGMMMAHYGQKKNA